ncbi:tyrosine-protein phosphatase 99A-like isoform X1 [Amphibalanus amphitrite]|uniref:tyrosine-protein phosphatase 99A-like isoform X1 n=2 Tax=Amphibalanus amphitrite TaxID=1232801 RepID=UPI001C915D1F|nr:tyrosine-protein phosphatase 99A-like isoform X1 [Amphibalanus amphitrite]
MESIIVSAEAAIETRLLHWQGGVTTVFHKHGRVRLLDDSLSLQYEPVKVEDSGEYVCQVNGRVDAGGLIRLVVQDVPSSPARPLITNFTSRSVFLSWRPGSKPNNSPIKHYVIHVKEGEEGDWSEEPIITPDNMTSFVISDLQPYTAYSFRLEAVNGIGSSESGIASFPIITLREAPGGKPVILAAHNTSATAVRVRWRPLPQRELRGEFQAYKITYKERNNTNSPIKELKITEETVQTHTITGLRPYTQYIISIQVENPAGLGPSSTVVVTTDEGVPEAPRNVSILNVTDTTVTISWLPPVNPNGLIEGYRIYFTTGDFTNATWIKLPVERMQHTLTDLAPFSNYSISVKAFTRSVEGRESVSVAVTTDVSPPSPPRLSSVTCQADAGLLLRWRRPRVFSGGIDYYVVSYSRTDGELQGPVTDLQVTTDTADEESRFLLPNLTAEAVYEVRLRAATRSLHRPSALLLSPLSAPLTGRPRRHCRRRGDGGATSDVWRRLGRGQELDPGVIAGIVCASCAFLLALLALAIWRRYFQSSYYYLDDPVTPRVALTSEPAWQRDGPNGTQGPIPADAFPVHVATLHADADIGFCKEYDEVLEHTMKLGLSSEVSQTEENKLKNRYQNIDAYDHTLVPLRPLPGQRRGDYINANYIDGYLVRNQYIGAQGPLTGTFGAFWRLIWEQRVQIVVMITNLVERNRKKCDMYWPKEGTEVYGPIQVELLDQRELATYTIRKMLIKHIKHKKKKGVSGERIIYQYHYTSWPDHGVPDHPLPILSFVRKSAAANGAGAGPILVHCSAGVGRTGTYIVLDAMMNMLKQRGTINVFGFLKHIRTQRNFLVQTEDQYIFTHDALLEALEAGETDVRATRLTEYLQQLRCYEPGQFPRYTLDRQYQLVTSYRPTEVDLAPALTPCNQARNRCAQFVPVDRWRVHLSPRPGIEGSDYINATPLIGYEKLSEFIITQHPLPHTVDDFWRMVWEHNVQTVVVLSPIDAQHFPRFWPSPDDDLDGDSFRVRFVDEPAPSASAFATVDLVLQSCQDDYQVSVRVICCPEWPHTAAAGSPHHLIDGVQQATLKYQNGPIVVVDRFGGTEAATFCCLTTLSKQLMNENSIDVYLYAKLYHMRRPGIWRTQDDFTMLYHAMEGLVRPTLPQSPSSQSEAESLLRPRSLHSGTMRVPPDGRECYVPAECV